MTRRCLNGTAPQYLAAHRVPVSATASRQHLRSAASHQLVVPSYRLSSYGRRIFSACRSDHVDITFISPLPLDVSSITQDIFYQRVSIASYASAGIARAEMSVRLSVRHTPVLYQNEENYQLISSPSESLNILVSTNIWFITKFDRGHPPSEGDF